MRLPISYCRIFSTMRSPISF